MSDLIGNDTLTFLNDTTDLDVFTDGTLGLAITGTWNATVTFTASIDGTTYTAINPVGTTSNTTTTNGNFFFNVIGLTKLRIQATAFTSGTVVNNWAATELGMPNGTPYGGANTTVLGGTSSATTTGLTTTSFLAAGTINATVVKASPGNVYMIHLVNTSAAIKYVKFYNKTTTPAPATDNALLLLRLGVSPTSSVTLAYDIGIPFTTGIGLATVTGTSDTDATAVTAADLMVNVSWR